MSNSKSFTFVYTSICMLFSTFLSSDDTVIVAFPELIPVIFPLSFTLAIRSSDEKTVTEKDGIYRNYTMYDATYSYNNVRKSTTEEKYNLMKNKLVFCLLLLLE